MTMAKQTKAELEAQVEELRQRVEKLEKLLGASGGGGEFVRRRTRRRGAHHARDRSGHWRSRSCVFGQAGDDPPDPADRNNGLGDAGARDGTGFARDQQMVSIGPG